MGAVFAIIFFIALLIIGLIPLVLGIVGLIVVRSRKKNGNAAPKAIKPLSIVAIVIGAIIIAIPIGFFGFIFMTNATLQDEVTITDIVIEEYGYQHERFTADGVVYVRLDDHITDATYYTKADAVFTYKYGDSIFDRSQTGNYYSVENPYGFDLVCDKFGTLFCPESQVAEAKVKLTAEDGYIWCVRGKKLSNECAETIEYFFEDPAIRGYYIEDDIPLDDWIYLNKTKPDGVVSLDEYEFVRYEGSIYYVKDIDMDELQIVPVPQIINDEILEIIG